MFEQEVRQAVNIDLVNICTKENLNKKFWKRQNEKFLTKRIKAEREFRNKVMTVMPEFDRVVCMYEMKWMKPRQQFSIIEKDEVMAKFKELFGDRIKELMNVGVE